MFQLSMRSRPNNKMDVLHEAHGTLHSNSYRTAVGDFQSRCSKTIVLNEDSDGSDMASFINFSRPNASDSSTPVSSSSSISHDTSITSCSSSETNPKPSSLKPSLKPAKSVKKHGRRASAPTVRFAELERQPSTRLRTRPVQKHASMAGHGLRPSINGHPNPMLRYRHYSAPAYSNSQPKTFYRPVSGLQPPRKLSMNKLRTQGAPSPTHSRQSSGSASIKHSPWSNIPLPVTNLDRPDAPRSRICSYESMASAQSAPAVMTQSTPSATPQNQYNPLDHYIPCLSPNCLAHYSVAYVGPTFYMSSGPYNLSRLHGYCPHHAAQELREAGALCKRQWESLRQNAGRKTLGAIAKEFDIFLERFRQDRRLEDVRMLQKQKKRLFGSGNARASSKGKAPQDHHWNWRYTSRLCTSPACSAVPYSPYANDLFAFYMKPRPSSFLPLQTMCPGCAKAEVERFEESIKEKWNSKNDWNLAEWNDWCVNIIKDREMDLEFWLTAQEKVVRESGPVHKASDVAEQAEAKVSVEVGKTKRRSIFSRLFRSVKG